MSKLKYANGKEDQRVKEEPKEVYVNKHKKPAGNNTEVGNSKQEINNEDSDEDEDDSDNVVDELQVKIDSIKNAVGFPYDPETELLPNLPAYRPEFREAESLCTQLFKQALCILEGSDYGDGYTIKLRHFIEEMQTPKYPGPKKIAFKGDSGVGKSSIINALLNVPDLSAQGASGSACTCVITEYRQASENQKSPFLAEIEFYNPEEINAMLQENYANYYAFYVKQPSDLEGDELETVEKKATTAKDIFEALYGDRTEFKDDKSTKQFLSLGRSGNDDIFLEQLSKWASNMITLKLERTGLLSFPADSAEDLSSKLEPFVEMQGQFDREERRRAAFWPLVRRVHVGLESSLLARGLVIVDLPGLSDTNATRRNTTLEYLRNCAYAAVVAPIKRVLTDDGVHRKLLDTLQRPGKNKLLICTMIDDLDPATTKASNVAKTRSEAVQHDLLAGKYKAKKQEVLQISKSLKVLKGIERRKADQRRKELSMDENILGALVQESLIDMRNESVRTQIMKKYVEINVNARELAISFVSTRDYELHLEGYTLSRIPPPVRTTGVPDLRYRLSSVPAADSLSSLEHYYKVTTRGMIDTMSIWATQSPFERRQDIRTTIERAKGEVEGIVASYIRELKQLLQAVLLRPLGEASRGKWGQAGLKLMDSLDRLHGTSFSAWCRNDGEYKTPAVSYRNWNHELLEPVKESISKIWHMWEEEITKCNDTVSAVLCGLIDQIRNDLKPIINNSLMLVPSFLQSLTTKKTSLIKELANFSKALNTTNATAYDIATSTEHDGALMEAMVPIYQRLVDVNVKPQAATRKRLLRDAIERGEPFSRVCSTLKTIFDESLDEEEAALTRGSTKIFDLILQDCDFQFSVDELPDARRDKLKAEVINLWNTPTINLMRSSARRLRKLKCEGRYKREGI